MLQTSFLACGTYICVGNTCVDNSRNVAFSSLIIIHLWGRSRNMHHRDPHCILLFYTLSVTPTLFLSVCLSTSNENNSNAQHPIMSRYLIQIIQLTSGSTPSGTLSIFWKKTVNSKDAARNIFGPPTTQEIIAADKYKNRRPSHCAF